MNSTKRKPPNVQPIEETTKKNSNFLRNENFNFLINSSNSNSSFSSIKKFLNETKAILKANVSEFSVFIDNSKSQIRNLLFSIESNANKKSELLSMTLSTQQQISKEREQKLFSLEQKVMKMTEQISALQSQRINGAKIMELEIELEDKASYIDDLNNYYKSKIDELENKIAEQKEIMNNLKVKKFDEIKYQAEIDKKDRLISEINIKHKEDLVILDEKLKQNNDFICNLQSSLSSLQSDAASLKNENESKDIKIKQLTEKLNLSKDLSSKLQESQNKQKQIKAELIKTKKYIKQINDEKNKLDSDLRKSLVTIKTQQNELSQLQTENSIVNSKLQDMINNSLSQSQMMSNNTIEEIEDNDSDILLSGSPIKSMNQFGNNSMMGDTQNMISNHNIESFFDSLENNSILKYQQLNSQLIQEIDKNQLNSEMLLALKANLEGTKKENQKMKEQINYFTSAISRKDKRIMKMKNNILELTIHIQQKEKVINELLNTENKKSMEIDRLHQEIDSLLLKEKERNRLEMDTEINTFKIDKTEYQNLLDLNNQLKNEKMQFKMQIKNYNNQQSENERENSALKKALMIKENELSSVRRDIAELSNTKIELKRQIEYSEKKFTNQISILKQSLEEITNDNTKLTKQYNESTQTISSLSKKVESLRAENIILKNQNDESQLSSLSKIDLLKSENNRITIQLNQYKENEENLLKENQNLVIENAQYKAKIDNMEKPSFNIHESKINELQYSLNESQSKLINIYNFLDVKTFDEFQTKWNQNIEKIEDFSAKNKILKAQISLLNSRLEFFNKNFPNNKYNPQIENTSQNSSILNNKLKHELNVEKKKVENILNEMKIKITELEEKNVNKEIENTSLKNKIQEINNEIDTLKNIINFDTLSDLKENIIKLFTEKDQARNNFNELQNIFKQMSNEKKTNLQIIEKQKRIIDSLNDSIKKIKTDNLNMTSSLRKENYELLNKLQICNDSKENIDIEIKRFHELFNFEDNDDIFFVVSNEFQKLNEKMEELNFKLSQAQNQVSAVQSENQFLSSSLNEKKESILKLKEERNSLRKENLNLLSSIRVKSQDNTIVTQMKNISMILNKNNFADIPSTVSKLKTQNDNRKDKIHKLKDENLKDKRMIHELQSTINSMKSKTEELENKLNNNSLDSSNDQVSLMKTKIKNLNQKIEELNQENAQYVNFLALKDSRINSLEYENFSLSSQNNNQKNTILQLENRINEFEEKLNNKEIELTNTKTENSFLKTNFSASEIPVLTSSNSRVKMSFLSSSNSEIQFSSHSKLVEQVDIPSTYNQVNEIQPFPSSNANEQSNILLNENNSTEIQPSSSSINQEHKSEKLLNSNESIEQTILSTSEQKDQSNMASADSLQVKLLSSSSSIENEDLTLNYYDLENAKVQDFQKSNELTNDTSNTNIDNNIDSNHQPIEKNS